MMKRLSMITLLLVMLALPAQAETWFPDVSGTRIHRDPFCSERLFTMESFFLPAIQVSPHEMISTGYFAPTREYALKEIVTADATYAVCPHCDGPAVEVPESTELYYNPAGGTKLHRNPDCPSVARKYKPMRNINEAIGPIPQEHCNFCGPRFMTSPADIYGWNATPEEKALILPGVWTAPSEDAIHYSAAADAAYEFLLSRLPKPREYYAMSVAHYDQVSPDTPRATYKVIVTSAFRAPVSIVYVDALTGEVFQHHIAVETGK